MICFSLCAFCDKQDHFVEPDNRELIFANTAYINATIIQSLAQNAFAPTEQQSPLPYAAHGAELFPNELFEPYAANHIDYPCRE